jgi:hypothetical protein
LTCANRLVSLLPCACSFQESGLHLSGPYHTKRFRISLNNIGKDRLTRAVLLLRENQITVFANGRYMQFNGPPSLEFVNVDSLLMDLEKTGTDAKQLRKILQGLPKEPKTTKTLTMKSEARAAPSVAGPQEPEALELMNAPASEEKSQSGPAKSTAPASAALRETALD